MADPCVACKKARQSCKPGCFLKDYFDDEDDYQNVHEMFHGPQRIIKLLKACKGDRHHAARCMVQEANARTSDPEGGAWGIVEGLQAQVHNLTNQLQNLEEDPITAATALLTMQHAVTSTFRITLFSKRVNDADLTRSRLLLLKIYDNAGSIPGLNGEIYELTNGTKEEPASLFVATSNRGTVRLRGWKAYAEKHGIAAGDNILIERLLTTNEDFLVISHEKATVEEGAIVEEGQ